MRVDESMVRFLLGYLTQEQVDDAVAQQGEESVREVLRSYGWDNSYEWGESS